MATIMNPYGDSDVALQAQAAAGSSPPADRNGTGFYCSTSGTTFVDQSDLKEHYKSALHRYNLKRKVAGLPPVTKDWFDARREQLSITAENANVQRQWMDPLTKKRFGSEQTYLTYVASKKYKELVRKSGEDAPEPVIILRREEEDEAPAPVEAPPSNDAAPPKISKPARFKVVKPSGGLPLITGQEADNVMEEDKASEDGSGWETASDVDPDDPNDPSNWEAWDLRCSLFDNHMSKDFEANLEYMFKKFGFYFPDAEYLKDPEGLLKYLGTKIQYGKVSIANAGDDDNAKQFRTLHAVQRHMVDRNQCKMFYDGGEDEYAEYYVYDGDEEMAEGNTQLATGSEPAPAQVLGGFELLLPGPDGSANGGKILGTREFARYYRQKHRPVDDRQSVVVGSVQARYRAMGVSLVDKHRTLVEKKAICKDKNTLHWEMKRQVRQDVWSNFNKNLGKGIGREY